MTICLEQGDHINGFVSFFNILFIMLFCFFPLLYCSHFLSSSWGILQTNQTSEIVIISTAVLYLKTCPSSWAIVYELASPLSLTIAQLDGRHIDPTSATPSVVHMFAVEFLQMVFLKKKILRDLQIVAVYLYRTMPLHIIQ